MDEIPADKWDGAVYVPGENETVSHMKGAAIGIAGNGSSTSARESQGKRDAQDRLLNLLVSSQEAVRRRIQMDIHDGPLQSLSAALMALDRAMRRREENKHERADFELRFLREALEEAISELRAILGDLSEDVLTGQGLIPALHRYLARFSQLTGIRVRLLSNFTRRLPPAYELLIYRLVQESLANARKHAAARNIVLSLSDRNSSIHLTVKDDGLGFDTGNLAGVFSGNKHGEKLGLRSMQERARAVGCDFRILSEVGKGTALHFACPLPQPSANLKAPGSG